MKPMTPAAQRLIGAILVIIIGGLGVLHLAESRKELDASVSARMDTMAEELQAADNGGEAAEVLQSSMKDLAAEISRIDERRTFMVFLLALLIVAAMAGQWIRLKNLEATLRQPPDAG